MAAAGIICRVLGVVFRIPLTNIVGNFGMGLYQMVYPLYALLLIVSSAGVPVAISKMVAREKTNGGENQCKKILWNAVILLGIIGLVVSALFMVFSGVIASAQGNNDVGIIYIAIAPSVFLVCVISALRGYFQGLQNMIPTAISQIIEQIVKVGSGLVLALMLLKTSVVMAVFGAILAVTVSEIVALLYLAITYLVSDTAVRKKLNTDTKQKTKKTGPLLDLKLMGEILKQSLPITAMASIFPLILVFDSMVIINLLEGAGQTNEAATQLFGIQSGVVHALINLPAVIGIAIATAVVPTVSSLIKQQKTEELRTKSALAVKIVFLISVFFVFFYMLFADKIIDLLYHNAFKDNQEHFKIAVDLLKIESLMIALMGITQVFSALLQASDKSKFPLIALAVGGAAKIIFELIFINTKMGIYAVSVSNVICFSIAGAVNTYFALRTIRINGKIGHAVLRVAALVVVYFVALWTLNTIMPNGRWWLVLIGAIAVVVFGVLVNLLKLISKEELNPAVKS